MASFKALNIESDDESDIIIDDTKEIQIEEALKLYQTALSYHSAGPASFYKAAEAYRELFNSEIFQYPESQNELQRIELYGPAAEGDPYWEHHDGVDLTNLNSLDISSSTLPQILHLSHKNYAQFKLESLAARLDEFQASVQLVVSEANEALDHFVAALDKDDTDVDLWRQTAAVTTLLDSKRIGRLCLEASLDNDDEGLQEMLSMPSFEVRLATQQLDTLVKSLDDHLSSLQAVSQDDSRRTLLHRFELSINRFQNVVNKVLDAKISAPDAGVIADATAINISTPKTWAELGEMLLLAKQDEQLINSARHRKTIWKFELPSADMPYLTPPQEPMLQDDETIRYESLSVASELQASTVYRQFPGLEIGRLPLQLHTSVSDGSRDKTQPLSATSETTLPTRKRSGETAGLLDNGEEGRARSKRIRARDSLADPVESKQAIQDANVQWEHDQHLNETQQADDWLYETIGPLFARVGIGYLETIKSTKALLSAEAPSPDELSSGSVIIAQRALFTFMQQYNDNVAQSLLTVGDKADMAAISHSSSKTVATKQSEVSNGVGNAPDSDKLLDFLESANAEQPDLWNLAVKFVMFLTYPSQSSNVDGTSYMNHQWSEQLKAATVRIMVAFDSDIFARARNILKNLQAHIHQREYACGRGWIQSMFELHLDVLSKMRKPGSGIDSAAIAFQADRVDRWFELLREICQLNTDEPEESLDIRFLWASTTYVALLEDVPQDRVLAYMQDLRLRVLDWNQSLRLANNAIMPEISLAALDQQISQLTTKDFFDKVASMNADDPASLIEMIEPLLEAVEARRESKDAHDLSTSPVPAELILFLESSGPTNIMQLWLRLLDAYVAVGYKPMIVRVLFRVMRLAMVQIEDSNLHTIAQAERIPAVLTTLRLVQRLTADILQTMQKFDDAFDCIDDDDIHSAFDLYDMILRLLQVFNVFEDPIRIGKNQRPMLPSGNTPPSFEPFSKLLHEMQLQVWTVLYELFKECIKQNEDLFLTPYEDRFEFLRTLHRNLGIREICGGLNRTFVRMLRDEFFKLSDVEGYDSEQAQVLYDLYGLNCFLKPGYELMEHKCTHDAFLDRGSAFEAVDMLLVQAQRLPIKELVRHTLKDAIEKVHGALNRKKPTDEILRNRDTIRDFLRSPLNPLEIFRSFRGEGNELHMLSIPDYDAPLAAKGWYFLMGHISLVKFRTMKRSGPTPTEDIDIAIAFFMQELEYSFANWETWFRLGQAYDTKLEESVAWSSEKLNSSMADIIQLQKAVIHCFTMALALAFRSAQASDDMNDKLIELYTEFAMRVYSASRAPFAMLAFTTDIPERYVSRRHGIEKQKFFEPLPQYAAVKLAKILFQRAIAGNSQQQWILHYSLAKCLWKMYRTTNSEEARSRPKVQDILESLYYAIELAPKKDSKDTKREPILEPHYKLVSIVHKLICMDHITLDGAKEALEHTHYAQKVDFPTERSGWTAYVLALLRALRNADKANWHHRIIARSAKILWEDPRQTDFVIRATDVKAELTQQLFTKTMVLQVWRPEAERPGRHFVYCARYTRFFVKVLQTLEDRDSLDALARRVRRRTNEIFEHSLVWHDIVTTYLRLLRARAGVAEGLEISTFSNIFHEDFLQRKEPLEKWMQRTEPGKHVVLDVLREVLELKKINQNLMKTGPIDDLIGDTYAYLFNTIGRQLWDEVEKEEAERKLTRPISPAIEPAAAPLRNVMDLAHLMNTEPVPEEVPATAEASIEADAPTKRKTGIGRREIRVAADVCAYKAPSANGSARHSISSETVPTIPSTKVNPEIDATEQEESVLGSIDDDADDESELSEVDLPDDEDTNLETVVEHGPVNPLFATLSTIPVSSDDVDAGDAVSQIQTDKSAAEGRLPSKES